MMFGLDHTPIKGDAKWSVRRNIMLYQIYVYQAAMLLDFVGMLFGWLTADETRAFAILIAAVATPSMSLTGLYMGIAEYGRVKGVINNPPAPADVAPAAAPKPAPAPPLTVDVLNEDRDVVEGKPKSGGP